MAMMLATFTAPCEICPYCDILHELFTLLDVPYADRYTAFVLIVFELPVLF
jgi:hypothetical protein